jgi:hypothetical protein
MELDLDSIEVAKRVRDIQLMIGNSVQILRHGLELRRRHSDSL